MLDWFLLFRWLTPTFEAPSWQTKKSLEISMPEILFDIMLSLLAVSKKLSFIFPIFYPLLSLSKFSRALGENIFFFE